MISRDEHFRQIAYRISPYFDSHSYNMNSTMLNVADEMADYIETQQTTVQAEFNHNILVDIALNLESVMYEVVYDKKISAIKKFREITSCGLKTAKEVIEDERVWSQHGTAVPPGLRHDIEVGTPGSGILDSAGFNDPQSEEPPF